jgi:hypothetical protein
LAPGSASDVLYAVAMIGVLSFLSGASLAWGHQTAAVFSACAAIGVALWLRWRLYKAVDDALQQGIVYRDITKRRLRELPPATTPIKRED